MPTLPLELRFVVVHFFAVVDGGAIADFLLATHFVLLLPLSIDLAGDETGHVGAGAREVVLWGFRDGRAHRLRVERIVTGPAAGAPG